MSKNSIFVSNLKDKIFYTIIYTLLIIIGLLVIVPMLYCISVSLTPYEEALRRGGIILWPSEATLQYYRYVLNRNSPVLRAYGITVLVTIIGTFSSLMITVFTAYPLSKKYLPGRTVIMYMFFITMLFNGGLIPTYLTVRSLGMVDKLSALIIPSLISVFNMIVMRSFFISIPDSLEESARLDGCNDIGVLFKIVIPTSIPAMATIGLFYAVSKWNMFFDAMIYINNRKKFTLQVILREILVMSQVDELNPEMKSSLPPLLPMQMTCTMIAVLPMMILYPFIQRYFVKGMMIGAIKA
ncbi:MAG TPA: carbohydrate ABC transporter permease [Clostridiales bacterium]|nr:carbohydrate ABC transporter permease [Clostridiales bacterium]